MKTKDKIKTRKTPTALIVNKLEQKGDKIEKSAFSEPNEKNRLLKFDNVKFLSYIKERKEWLFLIADLNGLVVSFTMPSTIELFPPFDGSLYEQHKRFFAEHKELLLQTVHGLAKFATETHTVKRKEVEATKNIPKTTEKPLIENYDYKKHKFWERIFEVQNELTDTELANLIASKYRKTITEALNIVFKSECEGYIIDSGFPIQTHRFKLNIEAIIVYTKEYNLAA